MKNRSQCLFGGALISAGMTSAALAGGSPAAITIHDTLVISNPDDIQSYDDGAGGYAWSYGSMTIDVWDFEVFTSGYVVLDMLSYEFFETGFDPSLTLFHNDGEIFSYGGNYIDGNDDYDYNYDYNGSVDEYDSFMRVFLEAGQYSVAVGYYSVSVDEINKGISEEGWIYGPGGDRFPNHGQYQFDIFGDVGLVPAPGTFALLGFGALATTRRRR